MNEVYIIIILGVVVFLFWMSEKPKAPPDYPYYPNTSPTPSPPIQPPARSPVKQDSASLKRWKESQKEDILSKISVSELLSQKPIIEIRYADLIYTREWYLKRLEVMLRDKHTCQDCSQRNDKNLQVHHNYYLFERLPWDIENTALVTLCRNHHRERHNGKIIPIYTNFNGRLIETESLSSYCPRCSGMGYFPEYRHVEDGVCFRCRGECLDYTIFTKPLREVRNADISSELDRILNSITQDYFELYLTNQDVFYTSGGNHRSNNTIDQTEASDDLPF